MKLSITQYIGGIALIAMALFGVKADAATLINVGVTLSNLAPNKQNVTQTIKFTPLTNISAPGDVKITWASGFNFASVAPAADISVSGGGVTWDAVQAGDLNTSTRVLTLNWSSGTLTSGSPVTVTMNFTKNPSVAGSYDVTVETGTNGFATATDSRTTPVRIVDSGIAVSVEVPYPETNPTVTNVTPTPTIIISSGATQVISFDLTDVNNDNVTYTVTPSSGSISVSPSPTSPVSSTKNGVTVTFTYFANGATGAQTITITADDAEATGGGLVTETVNLFII